MDGCQNNARRSGYQGKVGVRTERGQIRKIERTNRCGEMEEGSMSKGRLEAFSDGVLAIIITIMVLDLKPPQQPHWSALAPVASAFLSYVLSFVFVGIYWNNHHHLLQSVRGVNGAILWANLHLLFWLSLTPLVTNWMGATEFSALPVAAYGSVLLMSGFAYYLLTRVLVAYEGKDSPLAVAVGRDGKGKLSVLAYAIAIPMAFFEPLVSCGLYILVALIWLVPDQRIESVLRDQDTSSASSSSNDA
jgi:uncharacterized membrane protein